MTDRASKLLRRCLEALAAVMRGESVPQADLEDLCCDVAEHLEGAATEDN